jgi:glucose/arabinose dehydrogenase
LTPDRPARVRPRPPQSRRPRRPRRASRPGRSSSDGASPGRSPSWSAIRRRSAAGRSRGPGSCPAPRWRGPIEAKPPARPGRDCGRGGRTLPRNDAGGRGAAARQPADRALIATRRLASTLALLLSGCQLASEPARLDRLNLPPGFAIAPFARVPGARALLVAEDGAKIYVATGNGEVFAILDPERDRIANEVVAVAGGLEAPSGLALADDGDLLIVDRHRILRLEATGRATVVVPPGVLPEQSNDGWRYAGRGPDGRIYVALDAPCASCPGKGLEGTIVRLRPDGHELEIFARGVRGSAGFDWHPVTGEMFFTDHGDDGADPAPDELNRAPGPGLHFGPRPQLSGRGRPRPATPPALALAAHGAARGIAFYQGRMFPEDYRNDALIAQHGSGDRSEPTGYRIMRVRFSPAGQPQGQWVFIDGWLGPDGSVSGRPVDLEELPDGSLLISDDHAGLIYRVTYQPPPRPVGSGVSADPGRGR